MQSYTVEVQFDADAVDAAEAEEKVKHLLRNELQNAGVDFRITAVFDEMGERVVFNR